MACVVCQLPVQVLDPPPHVLARDRIPGQSTAPEIRIFADCHPGRDPQWFPPSTTLGGVSGVALRGGAGEGCDMAIGSRVVLAAVIALAATATPVRAQDAGSGVTGNFAVLFGAKVLDENDWAPVDVHEEFGLMVDMASTDLPVGLEVRALRSESNTEFDSGISRFVKLETSELDVGVRSTTPGSPSGYLAGGVAKIDADLTITGLGTASDSAYGFWIAVGGYFLVGGPFVIGIDGMLSTAEVDFNTPVKADVGGVHINVWAGLHF
jgi:hypothetical protein